MVYPIGRILSPFVTFPVKHVKGLENLPKDQPFVLASNHNSFIDAIVLAVVITKYLKKKKIYVISAMFFLFDILSNLFFSEFGGTIRLKKKVRGSYLKPAIKQLKKGNIICIFPEGIPSKKTHLRKGKTGVARLVLSGKVPVVPVGIQGTLYIWSRLKWLPRPKKKVIIQIGKPINFRQYYNKNNDIAVLDEVTTIIMKEIASLIGQKYTL